jgi:type I restriction enzyme S subunit
MKVGWAKLENVACFINGGAWKQSEYVESGVPVVRVSDCKNGVVDLTACKFLPPSSYSKYHKHRLCAGDLVIATVGSHPTQPGSVVGRPIVIPQTVDGALLNQNAVCIRPRDERLNKQFLAYLGKSKIFHDYIIACARGAANQVRMAIGLLKDLEIPLPPLPFQRRIASILSAYDDLIENNQRRIKILEDMARALYREWFVEFRFPGHESVPLVDSPLGKVPEGWEIRTVKETFEILGGGTPSKKVPEYWDNGTINWYTPTDLTSSNSMFMDRSGMQITQLGLNKSSAKLFPPFSVMMTSRATLGVISINTSKASTNQGFITCLPNHTFPLYTLYHWLKENVDVFIGLGSGATFKEITKGVFKDIKILVPHASLVCTFEDRVGAIAEQALVLQRKNQNLRRTRDLLLPRLLSGQLDVTKALQEQELVAA